MANLLVLTRQERAVLPSLDLLDHQVQVATADASSLPLLEQADLVVLDGTVDLAQAKALTAIVASSCDLGILLVVVDGALGIVRHNWGMTDFVLASASAAEVDARIRLALAKSAPRDEPIETAGLRIDEANYQASIHGKTLDLTFKEFELLRFLASHPVRVFTREQILSEVWGYDYFGGTRTVDVHVRRLRAKLGDLDQAIGTVRNVGYRFALTDEDSS